MDPHARLSKREQLMAQNPPQRIAALALACYLAFLAWVLLWPSAGPASSTVDWTLDHLWSAGLSQQLITGTRVEFVLNTIMLAPVPLLAMAVGGRWTWVRWTAFTFIVSCTVELFQALFLPHRSAQFQDVVSNTLGVLLGSGISTRAMHVFSKMPQGTARNIGR